MKHNQGKTFDDCFWFIHGSNSIKKASLWLQKKNFHNKVMLPVGIISVICVKYVSSQEHQCYTLNACSATIVSSNDSLIQCYGYKSCFNATSINAIQNSHINCHGSFSCTNSTSIRQFDKFEDIYCYGKHSCANVGDIYNEYGGILCGGETSCTNSKLTAEIEQDIRNIECGGDRSCSHTNITNGYPIHFGGYLSGLNSSIYNPVTQLTRSYYYLYDFSGASSGQGARIYCDNASICDITCYGNSCTGLTLSCPGGNGINNCEFNIQCEISEKNEICPNGYELSSFMNGIFVMPEYLSNDGFFYTSNYITQPGAVCEKTTEGGVQCFDWQDEDCYNSNKSLSVEGMCFTTLVFFFCCSLFCCFVVLFSSQ